ncbi:MAG: UDP-N-acetylglucosamine--N-acetylmuramyl-(pentapeptide) pyrophosphoryl-undecaprenol N-acetylglucosamine transferase [Tepidisphaerales bacterium]
MAQTPVILFAGGGTGGHLYPGISVAQELPEVLPGVEPLFLCTQRPIDATILGPTGYRYIAQPIVPPHRSIGGLLQFWRSWRETRELLRKVLREHDVVAVLGLGGYAAGVAVKDAAKRKIPAAVVNPDVIPGRANQYLLSYVQKVCCQFEATAEHVSASARHKLVVTGCPIRRELSALPPRSEAAATFGLDAQRPTLVITGASQGSLTVNEGTVEALGRIKLQGWQVLHLAGKDHVLAVREAYRQAKLDATVLDFTSEMHKVWAVADLAVSRAGASSCAELTACGVPSILMPYPYHKDMHQRYNAEVLVKAGAAMLCDDAMDRKKNAERLVPMLESLLYDTSRRLAMAQAARRLGKPDAARKVAEVLRELTRAGR